MAGDSIEMGMLRILKEMREAIVEKMFRMQSAQSGPLNSHSLYAYQNGLSAEIGVDFVPDKYGVPCAHALEHVGFFFSKFYHVEAVVLHVSKALLDKRISYSDFLNFLKFNRPKEYESDVESWFYKCFEEDLHCFSQDAICYALSVMGILEKIE